MLTLRTDGQDKNTNQWIIYLVHHFLPWSNNLYQKHKYTWNQWLLGQCSMLISAVHKVGHVLLYSIVLQKNIIFSTEFQLNKFW